LSVRSERGPVRKTVVVEDRAALDYVVRQNVVLIRREVHVLQFLEGGNRFRVCRVKSGRLFDCRNGIAVFVFKMTENNPLSVRSRFFEFGCESSERNVCNRLFGVSIGEFSVARVEFYFKNVGVGFVNGVVGRLFRVNGFGKLFLRYEVFAVRRPADEFQAVAGREFTESNLFAVP